MGLFDKLFRKEASNGTNQTKLVYAPVTGIAIALEDIPDPVFSQGVLGPGCGIDPAEGVVYAPFDGEVTQIIDTNHAIGLCSKDGLELLIHVGVDTVSMNGEGFAPYVTLGQAVKCGQKLMDFQIDMIAQAGHPTTIAVILCNTDDVGVPKEIASGEVKNGDVLIKV